MKLRVKGFAIDLLAIHQVLVSAVACFLVSINFICGASTRDLNQFQGCVFLSNINRCRPIADADDE